MERTASILALILLKMVERQPFRFSVIAYELEISLYREFPWVPRDPRDSNGNGKYYSSSVGMGNTDGTGIGMGINLVVPGCGNKNGFNESLGTGGNGTEKDVPAHL